jgi:hypothetical protein
LRSWSDGGGEEGRGKANRRGEDPEKGGNLIAVEQARVEAARPFEAKYGLKRKKQERSERCASGSCWLLDGSHSFSPGTKLGCCTAWLIVKL